jgi:hypothetical protein
MSGFSQIEKSGGCADFHGWAKLILPEKFEEV